MRLPKKNALLYARSRNSPCTYNNVTSRVSSLVSSFQRIKNIKCSILWGEGGRKNTQRPAPFGWRFVDPLFIAD